MRQEVMEGSTDCIMEKIQKTTFVRQNKIIVDRLE